MPAYHSSFNEDEGLQIVGNMALIPIVTKIRGPFLSPPDPSRPDIIEEALDLFRANSFFRNYEINGNADRTLIYLILFIGDCLTKIGQSKAPGWNAVDAQKQLNTYALENFALPGEPGFPLNQIYAAAEAKAEADTLRSYLTQARQETVLRLIERVYPDKAGKPSKWWMAFQKRKFMGKSLGV